MNHTTSPRCTSPLCFGPMIKAAIPMLFYLFFQPQFLAAQNVGIANTAPTEKLTVSGNLLVAPAYKKSTANPDLQHTSSIVPGRLDSVLVITDSVYRIQDPEAMETMPPTFHYLPSLHLTLPA